jgi:hypothetical protein
VSTIHLILVIVLKQAQVPDQTCQAILQAFILALEDYSTDQRGDVGSWIRIASLASLGQVMSSLPDLERSIPEDMTEKIIGGIIKQGLEKLEPVRAEAARSLYLLRSSGWNLEGMGKAMSTSGCFRWVLPRSM